MRQAVAQRLALSIGASLFWVGISQAEPTITYSTTHLDHTGLNSVGIWQVAEDRSSELERSREEQQRALEEARRQMREASRKLAEVQRQSHEFHTADGERHFRFSFSSDDEDTPRLGLVMGPTQDQGVRVLSVTPESPAEKAGLQSGDVIIAVNGQKLEQDEGPRRLQGFFDELGELDTDTAVTLDYQRGQSPVLSVEMKPEILEGFSFIPFAPNVDVEAILDGVSEAMPFFELHQDGDAAMRFQSFHSMRLLRELELTELDTQLGQYFSSDHGLLVLGVPESMSQQLQRGDVLLEIDGRQPKDVDHAFRILRSYEGGETVDLAVLRQGRTESVTITLPEASEEERQFIFKRHRMQPPAPPAPPPSPHGAGFVPTAPNGKAQWEVRVLRT